MNARFAAAALGLLALIAYAPFLSRTDLLNPDEPRYALVAREMVESGNWLVPTLGGKPYAQKPPIFFWCIAALGVLRGEVDEVAARLPSVLAAVGTLLAVFLTARRIVPDPQRGIWVGLMAAAILGTTTRFLVLASRANLDCMLTLWTTLAGWAFLTGYPLHGEAPRYGRMRVGFALAGLAVITKGTGGPLFLLSVLLFLALARERAGWRVVPWGTGLLALLAVIAAWVVPAVVAGGPEYRETLLFKQTVTRVVDPWTHARPWNFYFKTLPQNFLPWTPFLLVAAWPLGEALLRRDVTGEGERRGLWFCLAAFLAAFGFFSVLTTKRDYYLLPALPWLSLACAWGLEQAVREGSLPWRVLAGVTSAAGALGGVAMACWPLFPRERLPGFAYGEAPPAVLDALAGPIVAMGITLAAGMVVAGGLVLRRRDRAAWCALVLATVAWWVAYRGWVKPAANPAMSGRALAERIAAESSGGEPVIVFGPLEETLSFYSRRRLEWMDTPQIPATLERLAGPERVLLVTTEAGWEMLLAARPGLSLLDAGSGTVGDERFLLKAHRP